MDRAPATESGQPIHPNFDDFNDAQWLCARVLNRNGIVIEFYVEDVAGWSPTKLARARTHFELFRLAQLFSTEAATELVNIKQRLASLHAAQGQAAVRQHLVEEADSRAAGFINSWQTAMYRALAAHHIFCDGGFQHI